MMGITNGEVGAAWPGYSGPEKGSCTEEGVETWMVSDVETAGSIPQHLKGT